MGDQDSCSLSQFSSQVTQNGLFRVGVDTGESIVQDQDPGLNQKGPADGDALFLPSRKGDPSFSDHRFKAFRESFHVRQDVADSGCLLDFRCRGGGPAKSYVASHRFGEQEAVLRDIPDAAPEQGQWNVIDVPSVDKNRVLGDRIEATEETGPE